ncbi:MAG TPA: iron-containing alcohol dehydrogenase, partial [Acidimicrobiia bacterium]|nr:iron-containing alcohol dehydrogenase [Acidimicrobiia bacterium]
MTEVIFGRGALRDAGDRLPPSQSPVLLLTGGRSFSSSGAEAALQPFVESRRVVHVGGVPANPSAESVAACLARATDESPSVIVAVGGGSVIDTAKLVALSMATG